MARAAIFGTSPEFSYVLMVLRVSPSRLPSFCWVRPRRSRLLRNSCPVTVTESSLRSCKKSCHVGCERENRENKPSWLLDSVRMSAYIVDMKDEATAAGSEATAANWIPVGRTGDLAVGERLRYWSYGWFDDARGAFTYGIVMGHTKSAQQWARVRWTFPNGEVREYPSSSTRLQRWGVEVSR